MMLASRSNSRTVSASAEAGAERTIAVLEAYEQHAAELFGFLLRTTRDRSLAEDALQETFVRLVAEVRAGRRPIEVRAWLFRVATNQVVSAARRRATVARWAPFLVDRGAEASSEDAVLARESRDRVEAALRVVAPDARAAMLLAAHGLGTANIARALGRTELATRSLLCRSRLRVRRQLELEEKT